jgi:hypothetical protein
VASGAYLYDKYLADYFHEIKIAAERKEANVNVLAKQVEEKEANVNVLVNQVKAVEANVNQHVEKVQKVSQADKDEVVQSYEEKIKQYKTLIGILANLQSGKPKSVNTALTQLETKANEKDLPNEYKALFMEVLDNTKTKIADPEIAKKLELTRAAVEKSQAKPEKPTGEARTIVFIHIQKPDPNAEKLRALFKNNGYLAPGIETVAPQRFKQPQVRYFRSSDAGLADELCAFLAKYNIKADKIFIRGFENSPLVRQKQFELWLTGDPIPNIQ